MIKKIVFSFAFILLTSFFHVNAQTNPYYKAGSEHNKLLIEVGKTISDFKNVNKSIQEIEAFSAKKGYNISLKKEDYTDGYTALNSLKNSISATLFTEVKSNIDDLKALDAYSKIDKKISEFETLASKKFSSDELVAYYHFLAVYRGSSEFWLPKDVGGQDGFNNWGNIPPSQSIEKINWWKVLACDGCGALGGAILGGGKGAIVGACVASACSAINQW